MATKTEKQSPAKPGKVRDMAELVGSFHTIGELGPAYQVLKINDDEYATIVVLESEETLNYRIDNILADPEA